MNEVVNVMPTFQVFFMNLVDLIWFALPAIIAILITGWIIYFISTILPGGKNEIRRGNR